MANFQVDEGEMECWERLFIFSIHSLLNDVVKTAVRHDGDRKRFTQTCDSGVTSIYTILRLSCSKDPIMPGRVNTGRECQPENMYQFSVYEHDATIITKSPWSPIKILPQRHCPSEETVLVFRFNLLPPSRPRQARDTP